MTSVRIEETKLVRPTMRRALCRCSGTRGFEVSQGGAKRRVRASWAIGQSEERLDSSG
jgi:hypothetical protein